MAKIQEKQFRARLPKTSHDLSQRNIFTSASGMLLPIWQDMALPGDKYYLDTDVFMRTQPLLTAAMADIDFSVDYFFVPLMMLYTPLQSQMWSTQDYISSLTNYGLLDKLPLFDWMSDLYYLSSHLGQLGDLPLFTEDSQHNQFERFGKSCIRLMSHLRYNYKMFLPYMVDPSSWEGTDWPDSSNSSPKFFPWQLLAYHTIYYKHYRNEDFVPDNLYYRNFDYILQDSLDGVLGPEHLDFYTCHYINYKKDYFLSASPTPVFNDVSLINNGAALGSIRDAFLSQREIRTGGSDGDSQSLGTATQTIQSVLNGDPQVVPQYGLGTNDLRKMFAVEKLLRITGRSEKSYDSQVLAHFGFDVPRDVLHNLSFLGSHKGKVHIGEVISTANTAADGTNLGEIAGRGYGKSGNNRQIIFTAPCHGAIMAIFHCQPETNYVGGFDRINAIGDIADFYNPEYDKLGKQPIYQYEVESPLQVGPVPIELLNKRLGWQYRYSQWKRKYNVISPAFGHALHNLSTFNNWNSWVVEQKFNDTMEADVPYINNYTSLVSPRITDSIFAQSFEPRWHAEFFQSPWLIFQYDPFLVNSFISCKKVSVMSQTGEPDIDGI